MVAITAFLISTPSAVARVREIYVAPDGQAGAAGTAQDPLDLASAPRTTAALLAAGDVGPIQVRLKSGVYALLSSPLLLTTEASGTSASPVTYLSDDAARPAVLTGALTLDLGDPDVKASTTEVATIAGRRRVLKVEVVGALRERLRMAVATILKNNNGGAFAVGAVFQDGRTLTRSRYPAEPALVWTQRTWAANGSHPEVWFDQAAGLAKVAPRIVDGKTEVRFSNVYQEFKSLISGVGPATGGVALGRRWDAIAFAGAVRERQPGGVSAEPIAELLPTGWSPPYHESGWLENNLLFLDRPGSWYFDDAALALYVVPLPRPRSEERGGGEASRFELSLGYNLVKLVGTPERPVAHVGFEHLTFTRTNWRYQTGVPNPRPSFYSFGQAAYGLEGAIDGNNTRDVTIAASTFTQTGASAIALNGCRVNIGDGRCSSNVAVTIKDNAFTDVGGSAISFDDRGSEATPSVIEGNTVNRAGGTFWDAPAIVVLQANNALVARNRVTDVSYTAFHLGWRCNYYPDTYIGLKSNVAHRVLTRLADGASFYSQGGRGEVADNDFDKAGTTRAPGFSPLPAPVNDLYLDGYLTYWAIHDDRVVGGRGVVNTSSRTSSVFAIEGADELDAMWKGRPEASQTETQCRTSRIDDTALGARPPKWWHFPAVQTLQQLPRAVP